MTLPRSPELQDVLDQAEDIARQTGQSLTSGHVLLALFTVSNRAAVFLTDRNITLDELLGHLETIGDDEHARMLDDVMSRGERIARGSSADELNSLHVLAALVRETDSHAHKLLAESTTDVAAVRATVMSYATGALPLPDREPDDPPRQAEPSEHSVAVHGDNEGAPSPISFHPSLDVDPDPALDEEQPEATGESPGRDTDPPGATGDRWESPSSVRPRRDSGRSAGSNTQVETRAPDDETDPADDGAATDEPDRDDNGTPSQESAEADVDADYQREARDAAKSLGSRLFDDADDNDDTDEDDDCADLDGAADADGAVAEDTSANDVPEETVGKSRHDEDDGEPDADEIDEAPEPSSEPSASPDLAGGRATTMPPSEETRRTRTEGWDRALADCYALDEDDYPNLSELGRNITREAAEGRIDRIVGRDDEITKLIDIVGKRRANNPILVGEPGVGKTAIVEGLAREFVDMAADDNDLGRRAIIELELGRVLSGTHMRGALSERLLGIKQEVEAAEGDIIVFLDEIHGWLDAGGSDGGDAAGELKTAMARGRFPCIGATTNDEFREFIEADPAFERRFQNVLVDEPDTDTAIEINEGIQPHYEDHHDVGYTDDALTASVRMSRRYIHDRRLPDKAISVLDLAGSRAARRGNDTVGRREIAEVVAETAGLPIDRLTQDDRQRFLDIEEHLHEKIVGQRHVIDTVSEVLRRNYAGFRGNRPIGSLLFLGPTGVGKTETVKVLADFLFHDRDAVVQIDMSEYMKSHSVSRFVGAPPGYVGHGRGGQLTEAIRRRPYQIVLLDELEKAHKDVLNVLLQLFEEGTLTDGKGRSVDFSNALIVMTSNLGSDLFSTEQADTGGPIGFGSREVTAERSEDANPLENDEVENDVLQAARDHLSPELWNRIDEKLVFMPLSRSEIADIARLQLDKSAERIREESGIDMNYGPDVVDHLIDNGGYDPELGARPMRQTIQRLVEGTVAREILRGDVERGDAVRVVCDDDELHCEQ